jgi:DNA repair exonuclease SbcCD nuclease subunit
LRGDSYRSLDQIAQYALKHNATAVIFAGDVFDAQPPAETVAHFLKVMRWLEKAKIPVLAIQGQHGRSNLPWPSIDPYVVDLNLSVKPYRYGGYRVVGLDNRAPEELLKALGALDKETDVLILHQACKGALPELAGWDLDPDWVPPHVRMVLMGDIHKTWSHSRRNMDGSVTDFVYTGSTHMRSIDEEPEKSFLVLHPGWKLERVSLETRPFKSMVVQVESVLETALKDIAGSAPGTLLVVKYDPRLPNVEERMRRAAPGCHILFRILPLESIAVDALKLPDKISLESCLDVAVDRAAEPVLHSFVLGLLQAQEPKAALAEAKKRILEGT